MRQFDIIRHMRSLTGFSFTDEALERVAMQRGVDGVEEFYQLTERDQDLMLADLLFIIYTTPTQTSSIEKKHGAFSQAIGSQTITDKRNIYDMMMRLYRKWGDPKADELEGGAGFVQWMD